MNHSASPLSPPKEKYFCNYTDDLFKLSISRLGSLQRRESENTQTNTKITTIQIKPTVEKTNIIPYDHKHIFPLFLNDNETQRNISKVTPITIDDSSFIKRQEPYIEEKGVARVEQCTRCGIQIASADILVHLQLCHQKQSTIQLETYRALNTEGCKILFCVLISIIFALVIVAAIILFLYLEKEDEHNKLHIKNEKLKEEHLYSLLSNKAIKKDIMLKHIHSQEDISLIDKAAKYIEICKQNVQQMQVMLSRKSTEFESLLIAKSMRQDIRCAIDKTDIFPQKLEYNNKIQEMNYISTELISRNKENISLNSKLVQLESENSVSETKNSILHQEIFDLRRMRMESVSRYSINEILYKDVLYREPPNPVQLVVIQDEFYVNYMKQKEKIGSGGERIWGNIVKNPLYIKSGNLHRRGSIVNKMHYIAPQLNLKLFVVNLQTLEYKSKNINSADDTELIECSTLNRTTAICCKENGYIYTYNRISEEFKEYYRFGGDVNISICIGLKDESIGIGDGEKIQVLKVGGDGDGDIVESDVEGTQDPQYTQYTQYTQYMMEEVAPQVILLTQGIYFTLFHYLQGVTTLNHFPGHNYINHFYYTVTPIHFHLNGFALTSQEGTTSYIELWHLDTNNHPIFHYSLQNNLNCDHLSALREVQEGKTVAYSGVGANCHAICLWEFGNPANLPYCWDKLDTPSSLEDVVDIIISPYYY